MKYIAFLSILVMLTGCKQLEAPNEYKYEQDRNRFNDNVWIITDSKTGCKYITFRNNGIIPLYKNSKEVDCDRG